ncbi:MAG TPA: hypothetical protein VFB54_17355 [Burkholderiales bacterium]|nr:hypothetical protein [Burkholderiales bacterium]
MSVTLYASLYYAIGVAFMLAMLLRQPDSNTFRLEPLVRRDDLADRLMEDVLPPLLGLLFVVLCWPWLIANMVRERLFPPKPFQREEFAVKREEIQEQLSIERIEELEQVFDPMHAAPELPFGHLNGAWKAFLGRVGPASELWSFVSVRTNDWGTIESRAGYVAVVDKIPGNHFLTRSAITASEK